MKRSFLFTLVAVAAIGLGTCTATAQTVEHHRSEQMKIGLAGFNFREFNLDQTLQMMHRMGVKYMSVKDFHLPQNSTPDEIDAFRQKLSAAGVEGYTLGPIYMNTKADVDRVFDYVRRYGVKMFIGVPAYDLLPYIDELVKKYDIRMAIHTHGPDTKLFPDAADVMAHVSGLDPRIGICLDLGHTTRFGASCVNDLKRYKSRIFDIHIKDETSASKSGQTCEMGRGVMDIPAIVRTLRKIGYTGVCSLEFEKDGKDPLPGMAESIGYLRGVCDAVK